ncbi:LexA family transcriptional regulator [Breznakiella homolactica]|uniref:LexA family transcriptional regulator n=1 Tax=Breznakiella homolactica TaxID=2798577 RepID=A0A7T7XQ40_9SPIR|nr:XRE family transcriptional regulator [Breznakiella homolactica]QQO10327.1 XRE family transcriptional regulator [Breznakiella homolactica]
MKYDWSDIIASIRDSTGLSSAELAKKLDVRPQMLNDIEKGRSKNPSSDFLLRLIHRIGFNPGFLNGDGPLFASGMEENSGAAALPENQERHGEPAVMYELPKDGDILVSEAKVRLLPAHSPEFTLFRFSNGKAEPYATNEGDPNAMTLLPLFGQPAAAGPGQEPNQLSNIESYIPVVFEMLGGVAPRNCGIVRVVGDSMTDMGLFNGDLVVFDRSQLEGDGIYVISIGEDVRVKRIEYRPFEKKIIISSENLKRYPNPEIISYEQAENMLRIHGKVICWMHRHPY